MQKNLRGLYFNCEESAEESHCSPGHLSGKLKRFIENPQLSLA